MDTQAEFNSNKFVIQRVNEIIANLNNAFNFDSPNEIVKWLRAFLRELWPKLTKPEKEVYQTLLSCSKQATSIPEDVRIMGGVGSGKVIYDLEQIALTLMDYADKHGLLMTNKDDPRLSVLKQ